MTQPAETRIYYAMALDPIHIGTGGYRLGRVDNTIVREPGCPWCKHKWLHRTASGPGMDAGTGARPAGNFIRPILYTRLSGSE